MPSFDDQFVPGTAPGAPSTRPDLRTQQIRLLERFADFHLQQTLRPGDLVQTKRGLSGVKASVTPSAAMTLWAWLDDCDPLDAQMQKVAIERGYTLHPDCLVGFVTDDGAAIQFVTCDSRLLRPLGEDERAALAPLLEAHTGAPAMAGTAS